MNSNPHRQSLLVIAAVGIFVALTLNLTSNAQGPIVGTAVEVRYKVQAYLEDGKKRTISQGDPIYLGEEIKTDWEGYVKMLLMDETEFAIGPKSIIKIDKFVYDPATKDGELNVQVAKGVFRFLTGQIVKKDPRKMNVNLPVGNIGIRGTAVGGRTENKESHVVMLEDTRPDQQGKPHKVVVNNTVNGKNYETVLDKVGLGSTIKMGQAPTGARPVSARDIADIEKNTSNQGDNGGNDSPFDKSDSINKGPSAVSSRQRPDSRSLTPEEKDSSSSSEQEQSSY
ncbi:MAG: FecR domain-containing protein [Candidatus Omnitrophota bacterium]|nr:FecR domain-containing protein [Candidatus Omnitrophota bacterium]